MRSIRRRLLAILVAMGAVAVAAPVCGASAAVTPLTGFPLNPLGGAVAALGGNGVGTGGCAGTNRPSFGGNTGSTSAQSCGAILVFNGPQMGQLANVMGPTIIGSPFTDVKVSAGAITEVVQ
jgi:hypothetical protein